MAANRSAITQAIFERLSAIEGVKTCSMRVKPWDEVDPKSQPAIFLSPHSQSASWDSDGIEPTWTLNYTVYLYVHDTSPAGPQATLEQYLQKIEEAFELKASETHSSTNFQQLGHHHTKLGGLAQYARVKAIPAMDGGVLGDQGVVIIEVEVLTA